MILSSPKLKETLKQISFIRFEGRVYGIFDNIL